MRIRHGETRKGKVEVSEHVCYVCGRKFLSEKSLSGHMRVHPERQWRGIHPPPPLVNGDFDDDGWSSDSSCLSFGRVSIRGMGSALLAEDSDSNSASGSVCERREMVRAAGILLILKNAEIEEEEDEENGNKLMKNFDLNETPTIGG
ncbi:hypothetical protein M569_05938 [Genlisea aurea]|uniref:C2H2-type domain-containing protein n=1 Tax=Genlisea aurea TaxID=192259 RepID=S8E8U5_9LAMI|nr:hypothetical protein M569_05938 [Genlisea aurea]